MSVYDAAYLDLAMRERAALASRDAVILAAAAVRGLTLYDLR